MMNKITNIRLSNEVELSCKSQKEYATLLDSPREIYGDIYRLNFNQRPNLHVYIFMPMTYQHLGDLRSKTKQVSNVSTRRVQ